MINLRNYQVDWCRAVWKSFHEGIDGQTFDRVLAVAATGAGKSAMASALMFKQIKARGGRCLFLANTEDLIIQGANAIERAVGLIPTIEQASNYGSLEAEIAVGSVQTLARTERLERFPQNHFSLVIGDEAHGSQAEQYLSILEYFAAGGAKVLGITATPERSDKKSLMRFFQHLAAEVPLKTLIQSGYLAPIVVQTVPLKINVGKFAENQTELLANAIDPYYEQIIEGIKDKAAERKRVLIFHPTIKASKRFAELMRGHGLRADHIDGTSEDRQRILEAFSKGEIQYLNNAQLLTTGVDIPIIDCIVVLRPTKSRTTYIQMVGRGTRLYCPQGCHKHSSMCDHTDRKANCMILDFLWQHENKNVMGPPDIYTDDPEEKAAMAQMIREKPEADLMQVGADMLDESSKRIISILIKNAQNRPTRWGHNEIAAAFQPELKLYEPMAEWEKMPVTPRQAELLTKNKINRSGMTRGHASKIIDVLIARTESRMATTKQVLQLMRFGHPDPINATFTEASAFLDKQFGA